MGKHGLVDGSKSYGWIQNRIGQDKNVFRSPKNRNTKQENGKNAVNSRR